MLVEQDPINPISTANSYLTLIDARALAALYGLKLPVDDTEAEAALIQGWAYVDSRESQMTGERKTTTQNTAYPRTGSTVRCVEVSEDTFPPVLLLSQVIAAEAIGEGQNLWGDLNDGKAIASEQVASLSVSYFNNGKTGNTPTLPRFESAIEPILAKTSLYSFNVMRG